MMTNNRPQKQNILGIGVSDVQSDETADPGDLIDVGADRRAAAERAMDKVREKFGGEAVELGLTFGRKNRGPETTLKKE